MSNLLGGGGHPSRIFGGYVPRQSDKWGLRNELERENAGLRRELERENGGLRNWLCRTRLAGTLAGCQPRGAKENFENDGLRNTKTVKSSSWS